MALPSGVFERWMMVYIRDPKCCLSYWFPKLVESGVKVPKTKYLSTDLELAHLLDGKEPDGFKQFQQDYEAIIRTVGLPAFLRTGQTSGKHSWEKTCYLTDIDDLLKHIFELVEFSCIADFFGLSYNLWVAREILPLHTAFTAFWGKMPINKERRYFIRDGKVECHHPYWPHEAFEGQGDLPKDWQSQLDNLNYQTADEIVLLTELSLQVAKHFDGYWSLDWAATKDGEWYAIDMAEGERSYHFKPCSKAPDAP